MQYLASSYRSLPSKPGIYLFSDGKGDTLYVGKAKNLKNRISSYFTHKDALGNKTKTLVSQISKIKVTIVESEIEALLLEANFIKKYNPRYNTRLTDGKAYPLIRITIKDKYPKVLIARREEDQKSLYFGPFPSSSSLKFVLRTIRKIFHYQSVLNHPKKPCLYYHLNLCPCPEVFKDKEYKKNIRYIIDFLKGGKRKIIHDLEKEKKQLIKDEYFEKAEKIQKKIEAINYITSTVHKPFEYEVNPNLVEDLRTDEIAGLKSILIDNGIKIDKLERIECYDISNTSGSNPVGSMIVFINGEKETSFYRRFKIDSTKYKKRPNDFAMIEEVVGRRIRHSEWQFPDLMIIDGGTGQVASALKSLKAFNVTLPVIGLAKREETIIVPTDYKFIHLPRGSKALQLVQRIRDEAHRFAISYHKKLRSKFIFS